MRKWSGATLVSLLLFSASAIAITPAEIASIKAGTQVELPTVDSESPTLEVIDIQAVAKITDPDGVLWYRFNGKRRDLSPAAIIVHIENGHAEVESTSRFLKLRDIGVNPKQIWKMDKQAQGELSYGNQSYKFNADDSDDAKYVDSADTQADISYYKFENTADDDLSLLVFEWTEDNFEVLSLEWVDSDKVKLK